jgi:hypothetical protein
MRNASREVEYREGPALSAKDHRRLVELLSIGLERLVRARTHAASDLAIHGDVWLYDGHESPRPEDDANGR